MAKKKVKKPTTKSAKQVMYLGVPHVDVAKAIAVKLTAKFQAPVSKEEATKWSLNLGAAQLGIEVSMVTLPESSGQ